MYPFNDDLLVCRSIDEVERNDGSSDAGTCCRYGKTLKWVASQTLPGYLPGASMGQLNVFLRGGLGNQLFQYSAGLFLAKNYRKDLILREDLLPLIPDTIGGVSRWTNQIKNFEHSGQVRVRRNQPPCSTNTMGKYFQLERMIGDLFGSALINLGMWSNENSNQSFTQEKLGRVHRINSYAASSQIVDNVLGDLKAQIHKLRNPSKEFQELSGWISAHPHNHLHLRLGDYLQLEKTYGSLSLDYINHGLSCMKNNGKPLLIFTQNASQIPKDFIQALRPNRIIDEVSLQSPLENLLLLSKGAGIICSNSTFSWWAATLSNAKTKVVVPSMRNRLNVFSPEFVRDHWIKVEANKPYV